MPSKVVLVGHCGPDSSFLRLAVNRALPGSTVVAADDAKTLDKQIEQGAELLLLNRVLDYGFDTDEGVELVRQLRAQHPKLKMILVSNYDDAQQAAVRAGALPGFGKRDIGTPRVTDILKGALAEQSV
jgi:two-component system, chemotaxis family, chemotaxis protein CheY